jgi:methylthioribulose-1-phosphate dehydratase
MKNLDSLCHVIHEFNKKGWSPATSTNYSIKEDDQIFISRSGVDKSLFKLNDLISISIKGEISPEAKILGYKSSAETEIHLFLYRKFPHLGCILHTHSLFGTFLSQAYTTDEKINFNQWEIQKGIKGVVTHESLLTLPIVSNSQKMSEITDKLESIINKHTFGFLIAGHGLYAWGENLQEAKRHIETFEFLLELKHLERIYGKTL